MSWKEIWNNKDCHYFSKAKLFDFSPTSLDDLIDIMDFDITPEDWSKNISLILEKTEKSYPDKVLEVGCGAGAWLFPFYRMGSKVHGIDFLPYLIKCAKSIMPDGEFFTCDADRIPFEKEKFDLILCNSVFQYFKSIEYAEKVLCEMLSRMTPDGCCLITDLFCEEKKEDYKRFRMSELKISEEEWNSRYSSVDHLYLNKNSVKEKCEQMGFNTTIINNQFIGYNHGSFRFDLLVKGKINT